MAKNKKPTSAKINVTREPVVMPLAKFAALNRVSEDTIARHPDAYPPHTQDRRKPHLRTPPRRVQANPDSETRLVVLHGNCRWPVATATITTPPKAAAPTQPRGNDYKNLTPQNRPR
jgi:hypothetical protein